MDNLRKIGLTALGTALVSTASFAGDMAVTGTAKINFAGGDNTNTGNGLSADNTMSFAGSGELDNGWTVAYSHAIDDGDNDANSITLGLGDGGTLVFEGEGGSGPVEEWDDVMPTANEESWDLAASTKSGLSDGSEGNNNFTYTTPELVEGLAITLFHQPSDAAQGSSTEWGLKYTGIEGLEVGYAGGENNDTITNSIDNTVLYAKYTLDAFTIGAQANDGNQTTANSDTDFRAYGVSYAVSDELSVSLGVSKVEHESGASLDDQEATGISFSYVSGGMTVAGAYNKVDNVGGTSTVDNTGYELNVAFAF